MCWLWFSVALVVIPLFEGLCLFAAGKVARLERLRYVRCWLAALLAHTVPVPLYLILAKTVGQASALGAACLLHLVILTVALRIRRLRQAAAWGAGFGVYALVFAAALTPALLHARTEARSLRDQVTLMMIGKALNMYAFDYASFLPASLDELYPVYLEKSDLVSPPDRNPLPSRQGLPCSYEYVGPLALHRDVSAGTIIAYTRKGVLKEARHVLFMDGAVLRMDGEHLQNPYHELREDMASALQATWGGPPPWEEGDEFGAWKQRRRKELHKFYELTE